MNESDCGEIEAHNAELGRAPGLTPIVASVRAVVGATRDAKSRLATILIAASVG